MKPLDDLKESAKVAYQAFVDMSNSKESHFAYLEALETKYESGGVPSADENRELEKLLSIHDKNVTAFSTAMAAVTDDEDRKRLFALIS